VTLYGLGDDFRDGQTIRFRNAEQAERGIEVIDPNDGLGFGGEDSEGTDGVNVVWFFNEITGDVAVPGQIDVSGYESGIGRLWVTEVLANNADFGAILNQLPESIVRIDFPTIPEADPTTVVPGLDDGVGFDRVLEVVAFSDVPDGLVFNDGELLNFVQSLTVELGGEVNLGDLSLDNIIGANTNPDSIVFTTLTINSKLATADANDPLLPDEWTAGTDPVTDPGDRLPVGVNVIGNIQSGAGLELKNVVINTVDVGAVVRTITFDSSTADDPAVLTITGTHDVTIKSVNTTDGDISSILIDRTDHSGDLVFTAGSPAAAVNDTEILTIDVGFLGDTYFGKVLDEETGDYVQNLDVNLDPYAGVAGNTLSLIDVSPEDTTELFEAVFALTDALAGDSGTGPNTTLNQAYRALVVLLQPGITDLEQLPDVTVEGDSDFARAQATIFADLRERLFEGPSVDLGIIAAVDSEDFILNGFGITTAIMGAAVVNPLTAPTLAADGTWVFNDVILTITGDVTFEAGGTIDFNSVDLTIEGDVDLSQLNIDWTDDASVDGVSQGTSTNFLHVPEGATLTLSVAQVLDLTNANNDTLAGMAIVGSGTVKVVGDGTATYPAEEFTQYSALLQAFLDAYDFGAGTDAEVYAALTALFDAFGERIFTAATQGEFSLILDNGSGAATIDSQADFDAYLAPFAPDGTGGTGIVASLGASVTVPLGFSNNDEELINFLSDFENEYFLDDVELATALGQWIYTTNVDLSGVTIDTDVDTDGGFSIVLGGQAINHLNNISYGDLGSAGEDLGGGAVDDNLIALLDQFETLFFTSDAGDEAGAYAAVVALLAAGGDKLDRLIQASPILITGGVAAEDPYEVNNLADLQAYVELFAEGANGGIIAALDNNPQLLDLVFEFSAGISLLTGVNIVGSSFNDLLITENFGDNTFSGSEGDDVYLPVGSYISQIVGMLGGEGEDTFDFGGTNTFKVTSGSDVILGLGTQDITDPEGPAKEDVLEVSADATAYGLILGDFVATEETVNNGTAILIGSGGLGEDGGNTIDVSLATGTQGYTLIGVGGGTTGIDFGGEDEFFTEILAAAQELGDGIGGVGGGSRLIGSAFDDIINGGNDVFDEDFGRDVLTGNQGGDLFVFNTTISEPVILTTEDTEEAVDIERLEITPASEDSSVDSASLVISYRLNGTDTAVFVSIASIDTTDAEALATAVASRLNTVTGITAVADGISVVVTGEDSNAFEFTGVSALPGFSIENIDITEAADSDDEDALQLTTLTFELPDGATTTTAGETYNLTITPKDRGPIVVDQYVADGTETATDLRDELLALLNISLGAISDPLTATSEGTNQIILSGVADAGGFEVTTFTGSGAFSGSGASITLSSLFTGDDIGFLSLVLPAELVAALETLLAEIAADDGSTPRSSLNVAYRSFLEAADGVAGFEQFEFLPDETIRGDNDAVIAYAPALSEVIQAFGFEAALTSADLVTDFAPGVDSIGLGLVAGVDGLEGNFDSANTVQASFEDALELANDNLGDGLVYIFAFIEAEEDAPYLLEGELEAGDNLGLLFFDANGDGSADGVIALAGVSSFIAADIVA
jgi:hypothetical protein